MSTPERPQRPAALDAFYAWAARRPRRLIAAGGGCGVALAVVFAAPAFRAAAVPTPVAAPASAPAAPLAAAVESEPLAVIGAYNAASIVAAASGEVAPVLPFFSAGSREPELIRAEFARRSQQGELHRSAMVRWGIAEQTVAGSSAAIVTQEVWDDAVFRDGTQVDSQRGTIVRIRYTLSREGTAGRWLIDAIDSTTVIP